MHNKTINFWVVKNTHLLEEPLCLPDFAHLVIPFELTVAHLDVFNIFFYRVCKQNVAQLQW